MRRPPRGTNRASRYTEDPAPKPRVSDKEAVLNKELQIAKKAMQSAQQIADEDAMCIRFARFLGWVDIKHKEPGHITGRKHLTCPEEPVPRFTVFFTALELVERNFSKEQKRIFIEEITKACPNRFCPITVRSRCAYKAITQSVSGTPLKNV